MTEPMASTSLPGSGASIGAAGDRERGSAESEAAGLRAGAWRAWLLGLALVVAVVAVYRPVWHASFIWDDDVMVSANHAVQSPDGLRTIWLSTELPDYFPLTSTVLWLEWRMWGGAAPGFHLTTILIHALAGVLLWRVLRRLKVPGAWFAAAAFALHPVNAESVAWIAEHKNTIAMALYLASLLAFFRFEDSAARRWYVASLVAFIGALLSKTAVVPFGAVLLLLAWWRRGRITRTDFMRAVPFFVAALGLALVTIWFQSHRAIGSTPVRTDAMISRAAIAGRAVWFYAAKALWPANLSFIYPRWSYATHGVLRFVPDVLLVATLAGLWAWRRHSVGRATLFGACYFVALLFPILGWVNVGFMRFSFVADRWQYFALIAPVVGAAAVITVLLRRFAPAWTAYACQAAILAVLGGITWARAGLFTDNETLWRATLTRNPSSVVAHTELGIALCEKGHVDEGLPHYRAALAVDEGYESAHYNLGYALLQSGRGEEAIPHLERAIALQADFMPAHFHLGRALFMRGDIDGAGKHFLTTTELSPGFAEGHYQLANVFLRRGQLDAAIAQFERALALDPHDANTLDDLAVARFRRGDVAAAMALFERALRQAPDLVEAHNNYATALLQLGRAGPAAEHFRAVLAKEPDNIEVLATLGWILAACPDGAVRNGHEALTHSERASAKSGGQNAVALRSLAAAQAECGQSDAAVSTATRAQELARTAGNAPLTEAIARDLAAYRAGEPVRDASLSQARAAN